MRITNCCMWCFARIFKTSKRKVPALLCVFAVLAFLINWKLLCTSTQPKSHIGNFCANYENGKSNGHLCELLCQSGSSITCLNLYTEKGALFAGIWMNESIIFKSLIPSRLENNSIVYLENDFIDTIKKVVMEKFNLAISDIDARQISYSQHSKSESNEYYYIEKKILWSIVHNKEYLALSLFSKFNVFPKLLGTCGSLYAVQRLNPITSYRHLVFDSQKDWVKRVKISIMILDFLLQLEETFPEPMFICDIKMNNFGVTSNFKKVKYVDLDSIHPRSVANRIVADGSNCKHHSDCDLADCRSFCNLITYKCQHGVVNNNLQIVCEKIFLGWMLSGRIMVAGLLVGPRTPAILIEILEKCANPFNENGIPRAQATKQIRKRLYDFLVHFM